jgi:CRP-like cAMP-binding protein
MTSLGSSVIARQPFPFARIPDERPLHRHLVLVDPCLRRNRLLQVLPEDVWARISSECRLMEFAAATVLEESGAVPAYVYFPTDAIVSLLYVTLDGGASEVARVGVEGLVGASLFLGGSGMPSRAVVLNGGYAFRVPADVMKAEFDRSAPVRRLMLRYTQSVLTQVAQTAACNRRHSLQQQVCRYLLLSLDRSPGNALAMTHEQMANMLGVRREGVTEAAGNLQRMGAIRCSRGRITVLDRGLIETHVCECYGVVRRETRRLLPELMQA